MTRKKTIGRTSVFRLTIRRRVDDAIAIYIYLLPLSRIFKTNHMSKSEKILNWVVTILTALTVLAQYILTHIPKTAILLMFVLSVFVEAKCQTKTYAFRDSTLTLSPSVGIELFSHELKTGVTTFGAMPGFGYGIKWNPYKWKSEYLLGLDLFASTGIYKPSNSVPADYYNIELVPILSILTYFHVGFGYLWKFGLNGTPNLFTSVIVTGISVPLP